MVWKKISGSLAYSRMIVYLGKTYLRTRKCKFILEYESGKFTWKRVSGHFTSSYSLRGIARGTAAYFIPTVFQNRYSKMSDGATLWEYERVVLYNYKKYGE